ncbi:hypothetical protein GSI_04855 [Ganoderma sinense ZZ0214-1]|uniref:Uncharacterized protein n=1 Tax=Ganoderma sinense ZZ0214-1 TaxID=1077348 RepID=A0A2G8SG38_9APHY|nr:hypothetical protein GSI_04855 [Ganoderma sinense ZZ0214-1]
MTTPRNAAHSALFCQEILLEIFGYLSPGWFPWDRTVWIPDVEQDVQPRWLLQKTLSSSELWRVLDHHVFVLKLLPWTARRDDNVFEGVLDLEPPIDERAWSRFRWYARFATHPSPPCQGCRRCVRSKPGYRSGILPPYRCSPPLSFVSAVLATSGLRATPLRSVELQCDANSEDDNNSSLPIAEFQHHLALIRAALPDALEAFRLRSFYTPRTEPLLPLATLFAPFLSFGHLKIFNVSFFEGCVLRVLDDDLRALARAWPRLEVLHIWMREMSASDFSTARAPTVSGLLELAKGCPRLQLVMLPALDVSALPEVGALPREGHEGVQLLDMSALVKNEGVAVEDVARVLDKFFPCLGEYLRFEEQTPQAKSWQEVQDAMMKMQAARSSFRRE